MKSVLITGANGFIGRQTLPFLCEQYHQVHACFSNGKPAFYHPRLIWHQVDLHDHLMVSQVMTVIKPEHLLHLAWFAKPTLYWTSPLNLTWLNSSLHLLQSFIEEEGKRVVMIGSCAEYDWQHDHCDEFKTPCLPNTLYGAAKHSLHLLSEILTKQSSTSFAWARLFFLFGPYEYAERLIPSVMKSIFTYSPYKILKGQQIRDFMYVKDAANALVTLLRSAIEGPINIASGHEMKIQELMTILIKKMNIPANITYGDDELSSVDKLSASIDRLKNEMQWQPRYTLEEAFQETITWAKEGV